MTKLLHDFAKFVCSTYHRNKRAIQISSKMPVLLSCTHGGGSTHELTTILTHELMEARFLKLIFIIQSPS